MGRDRPTDSGKTKNRATDEAEEEECPAQVTGLQTPLQYKENQRRLPADRQIPRYLSYVQEQAESRKQNALATSQLTGTYVATQPTRGNP